MAFTGSRRVVWPPGVDQHDVDVLKEAVFTHLTGDQLWIVAQLRTAGPVPVTADAATALAALVDEIRSGVLRDSWYEDARALLAVIGERGGATLRHMAGVEADVAEQAIADAMDARAAQLADYVGQTTADAVVEAYHAVRAEGGTMRDLADRIAYGVLSEDEVSARARTIARTEAGVAYNGGAQAVAEALDGVQSKTWRHDGSPKEPRWWHEDMDGETVALDDTFSNGLAYPCDPAGDASEVINCTCSLEYSTDPP